MSRRAWIIAAVIASLLTVAAVTAVMWRRSEPEPFAEQRIVAVALDLYGPPAGRAEARAEVTDPVAVRHLTRTLDRGSFTEPHPCVNIGELGLKRSDGSQLSIEILPGHDPDSFEYRYGGVYRRIDRSAFLQAVAPFGVPEGSFAEPAGQ